MRENWRIGENDLNDRTERGGDGDVETVCCQTVTRLTGLTV